MCGVELAEGSYPATDSTMGKRYLERDIRVSFALVRIVSSDSLIVFPLWFRSKTREREIIHPVHPPQGGYRDTTPPPPLLYHLNPRGGGGSTYPPTPHPNDPNPPYFGYIRPPQIDAGDPQNDARDRSVRIYISRRFPGRWIA